MAKKILCISFFSKKLTTLAAIFLFQSIIDAAVPATEEWPGTYGYIQGYDSRLYRYWIPEGVKVLRGINLSEDYDSISHDRSCHLGVMNFCHILYAGDPGRYYGNSLQPPSATQMNDFIAAAAKQSGHPELVNLPMLWDGQYSASWITSSFPGRVIGLRMWSGSAGGIPTFECREEGSYKTPTVPFSSSKNPNYTWSVQWGWGHGWYSARDLMYTWDDYLSRLRIPSGWDPLSGKPTLQTVPADSAWLGDPSTVYGEWPIIHKASQFTGNKNNMVWLPNEYMAFVWRAYSTRHPSQTQQQQGEAIANTNSLSGQPNFMITSPSRPYNLSKTGGKNYPVFPKDTVITIRTSQTAYTGIQKVEFYDGNRLLKSVAASPIGLYNVPQCTLSQAGVRALIAIITIKDNSGAIRQISSRPAIVYVADNGNVPIKISSVNRIFSKSASYPALRIAPSVNGVRISKSGREFDIRGKLLHGRNRNLLQ